MKLIHYEFSRIQNVQETNYIFQLVKGRKLSRIYHSHDFYEVVYFLQGEATHLLNEKSYCCTANLMVLLRPKDRHCFTNQSDDVVLLSIDTQWNVY